jgi:hypothetical protein
MSRNITASDRSALIRLASTLPVGSEERKAILAGLNVSHPAEFLRSLDQSLDVNTRMLDEGKLDRETEKRIKSLVTYLKKTKKQLLQEHPDLSSGK